MKTYKSFSSEQTRNFGKRFAKGILASRSKNTSKVLLLQGQLGSGKTTFVQGLLRGFGLRRRVASPTFVLMRRFRLANPRRFSIFHIDAYRLKSGKNLLDLGLREILNNPKNIILLEWPERVRRIFKGGFTRIRFRHGRKENERIIITQQ
jgi:tRNA threonylcarbamoyladenosine biosynthesis protein TsaE